MTVTDLDIWRTMAGAIDHAGLPAPRRIHLNAAAGLVSMAFGSHADAQRWAEWLPADRVPSAANTSLWVGHRVDCGWTLHAAGTAGAP